MVMAREYRIRGRVQGVGYRWHVLREAGRLGLAGWARNEGDGSVRVYAAGEPDALARLRLALERGPGLAHVDAVTEAPAALPANGHAPASFIITG